MAAALVRAGSTLRCQLHSSSLAVRFDLITELQPASRPVVTLAAAAAANQFRPSYKLDERRTTLYGWHAARPSQPATGLAIDVRQLPVCHSFCHLEQQSIHHHAAKPSHRSTRRCSLSHLQYNLMLTVVALLWVSSNRHRSTYLPRTSSLSVRLFHSLNDAVRGAAGGGGLQLHFVTVPG